MQITENTSIIWLYAYNEISKSLYKTLQAFKVKTLHDAFSFIETELISRAHRNELKKIKTKIITNISSNIQFNTNINVHTKLGVATDTDISVSTNIETLIHNNLISIRTYNCLKKTGLFTIADIFEYAGGKHNLIKLLDIRNFGRKSLTELIDILDSIKNGISIENTAESTTEIDANAESLDNFVIKYNELVKDEIYKSVIEYNYEVYRRPLSARANHHLDRDFASILDVLCLYFTLQDSSVIEYGKQTSMELTKFVTSFYNFVSSIIKSSNVENNHKILGLQLIKNIYPFLQDDEVEFVYDFKERNSHLPMFYLLYYFITRNTSRYASLTCRFYGIDQEPEDLDEISYKLGLSRERCRQLIATNELKDSSILKAKEWNNYDFLDDILVYNTFSHTQILESERLEGLSISAFAGLCSLIKQIEVCKIKRNSTKKYYLSEQLYTCFDFKNCIRDIENTLTKRCTQDIILPLSTFIDSYWIKEPTFGASKVEDAIIYILKNDYGICIGEDRTLHIMHNAIDRKEEIYKILEENGSPMHISQIMNALKLRNDELSIATTEQVKADIQRHPEIVPLGRSSSYAIKEWNLYTGTIRDLLYDILSNESTPISIEELYKKVSQIYPNTSIKSITSTMASDEQERFVRFVDLHYGIVGKKYPDNYIVWDAEEHSKKTFEERLREFESFLKSHRHLPRSGSEFMQEASLWRWYKRVIGNDISISEEQRKKISKVLNKNNDCLVTGIEYSFYRYCEEFKAYIEDNMEFPTQATDSAKYTWFMNNRKTYKNYDDKRKKYFEELIEYLYTYGYEA